MDVALAGVIAERQNHLIAQRLVSSGVARLQNLEGIILQQLGGQVRRDLYVVGCGEFGAHVGDDMGGFQRIHRGKPYFAAGNREGLLHERGRNAHGPHELRIGFFDHVDLGRTHAGGALPVETKLGAGRQIPLLPAEKHQDASRQAMGVDDGRQAAAVDQILHPPPVANAAAIAGQMQNLDPGIVVERAAQGGAGAEFDAAGIFHLRAGRQHGDREFLGPRTPGHSRQRRPTGAGFCRGQIVGHEDEHGEQDLTGANPRLHSGPRLQPAANPGHAVARLLDAFKDLRAALFRPFRIAAICDQ